MKLPSNTNYDLAYKLWCCTHEFTTQ